MDTNSFTLLYTSLIFFFYTFLYYFQLLFAQFSISIGMANSLHDSQTYVFFSQFLTFFSRSLKSILYISQCIFLSLLLPLLQCQLHVTRFMCYIVYLSHSIPLLGMYRISGSIRYPVRIVGIRFYPDPAG